MSEDEQAAGSRASGRRNLTARRMEKSSIAQKKVAAALAGGARTAKFAGVSARMAAA
jgi:hypothetical protein